MATQKAALVGCKEGPWVSTAGMRFLHLKAKVAPGTKIRVEQREDHYVAVHEASEGTTKLLEWPWTRVTLIKGDCSSALCFLVSGNS